MSQTRTFTVSRIMEIYEGVIMLDNNKYLEGVVSFKVGKLGSVCKSIVDAFNKSRNQIVKEARRKQTGLLATVSPENKAKIEAEVALMLDEMQSQIDVLLTQEEAILVPGLKLSEFIAKNDITDVVGKDGNEEMRVVVKAGRTLAPTKFFTLFGDIIVDDKNTDTD